MWSKIWNYLCGRPDLRRQLDATRESEMYQIDKVIRHERTIVDLIEQIQTALEINAQNCSALRAAKAEIEQLKRTDPTARGIDQNRHRAAQQRIRDLEQENKRLVNVIAMAVTERES